MINYLLSIECNNSFIQEREYIYSYFFKERYGIEYTISYNQNIQGYVVLTLKDNIKIKISDVLFSTDVDKWLTVQSMPERPLNRVALIGMYKESLFEGDELIEIFGLREKELFNDENYVSVDLFGSAFFLLTGYEELLSDDRNEFGNFPYISTLSYEEGFIDKPLVDQYVELLWLLISSVDIELKRKKKATFQFIPTHDIDRVFKYYDNNISNFFINLAGDLIKRRSVIMFLNRFTSFCFKGYKDPYNSFDFIMKESEKYGLKSIFYFKNSKAKNLFDEPYDIQSKEVSKILKKIDQRGHYIGIHPSYYTRDDKDLFISEVKELRKSCEVLNLNQKIINVRHHYLRYCNPRTTVWHDENGLLFDSSIGHRDKTGFRRGTCHKYSVFDLLSRRQLNVKEMPLIAMDRTLFNEEDNVEMQIERMQYLSKIIKFYRGDFVILWHNEALDIKKARDYYKRMVKTIID